MAKKLAEKNNLLMLPRPVVQAALLFMPANDSRRFLNGLSVHVEAGDIWLTAMDGFRIFRHVIAEYEGISDCSLIIPQFILKLALTRAKKDRLDFLALDVDQHFLGDIGFKPVQEPYPDVDFRKLKTGTLDVEHSTFSVTSLQKLQKACDLLDDGGPILPRLQKFERCAWLDLEGGSVAVAQVMEFKR